MNGQMEKEKQIEEMAFDLVNIDIEAENGTSCRMNFEQSTTVACELINKGYRKVVMCKDCKYFFNEHIKACTYWNGHATTETNYCSCAKMKGAE